jgi:predicted ATPase/class 3 adenylate cyclase
MFTDIEGSTRLARMLGDSYGAVLGAHRAVLRTALSNFGGVELFTEGDSFFVAFGDASGAVAACVAAQRALAAYAWPSRDATPRVRMGLHTGWATPVAGEYASAEVHRAARVAAAAHGGQVLCSEATALAVAASSPTRNLAPSPTRNAASSPTRNATWSPARNTSPAASRIMPSLRAAHEPALVGSEDPERLMATGACRRPAGTAASFASSRAVTATAKNGMNALSFAPSPHAGPAAMAGIDLLDLGPHRLRGFDDAERLFQLVAPGLERDFPRPRTPGAAAHNLPAAVTSFVGRRAELTELTDLVQRHRLVTVAGAGGAGKTRLALAAAGQLLVAYPDGVWVIDCATATASLPAMLAAALGLRAEPGRPLLDTLVERCTERRMLLVVETCEAAPAGASALVRRLLAGCPALDVLATSREPLGVHGELVWRIPPLAPADAFALLSERTSAARGGRATQPEEKADLARAASRLGGLPLAIELAAVRLRLLSAADLASRLDDPLAALDAGRDRHGDGRDRYGDGRDRYGDGRDRYGDGRDRHGDGRGERDDFGGRTDGYVDAASRFDSLTGSLDWSYRTLGRRASALLRRLAVFAGPVDLATAEWCGDLGALSELADKSLLEVVPGPRYRMSESTRGYAIRRLAAAGEERAARDRHVAWSLHALDTVAVDTDGQPRTVSLTELAPYVDEWRVALRWSADRGSVRSGLRLAGALDPWWREHDGTRDGRDLLSRLYGRLDTERIRPAELASAYLVHAGLADGRVERTRFLDRAEAAARKARDPGLLIQALAGHRITLLELGQTPEAERMCREVIHRAERVGVPGAALPAIVTVAELLWRRDALDEAAELLGGARQIEAGCPEDRGRRTVDWLLGMVALRRGDLVAAHDHLVVALRSRLRHGFRGAAADAVAAIAVRCAIGGDPATAATLFGGAESVRGSRRTAQFAGYWSARQAALRTTLGDAAFDAAYADGADAGFDRIVAMALDVEHPDLEFGSARFAPSLR